MGDLIIQDRDSKQLGSYSPARELQQGQPVFTALISHEGGPEGRREEVVVAAAAVVLVGVRGQGR